MLMESNHTRTRVISARHFFCIVKLPTLHTSSWSTTMGIALYDYTAITPEGLWAVGERLAAIVQQL